MPNYLRAKNPGGTFFLTFVSHDRRPFLTDDLAIDCILNAYREIVRRHRFLLHAYCVLPDHIHVLVTLPRRDTDFPTRCRAFKSAFTRAYVRAGGKEGQQMCRGTAAARPPSGSGGIGSIPYATSTIFNGISTTSILIRLSTVWCGNPKSGNGPRSDATPYEDGMKRAGERRNRET